MAATSRRYRVVIIAACPYPTLQGSQLLIKRLAEGLAERGHKIQLVAYSEGLEGSLGRVTVARTLRLPGLKPLRSGPRAEKLVLDLLLLLRTISTAVRHRAEILHAHNYEGALVGLVAAKLLRLPLVYHGHNAMAQELPTYFSRGWVKRLARRLGTILDTNVPRRADHCIAVSQELLDFLRSRGVASEGASYISPGAEVSEFPELSEGQLLKLRRAYGIGGRRMLLYTGNLDLYQNLELLFAALGRVLKRQPETVMVIGTHSRAEFLSLPEQLAPAIRVIGTDSFAVIRDLLSLADVALCPRTEWSGFPMKLLNYMAAGKAIVASAGSAKALTHQYNGLIVPDGDSAEFADAITRLLADDRLRRLLGSKARDTAMDQYSWERLLARVEGVYCRLFPQGEREEAADFAWAGQRILKS